MADLILWHIANIIRGARCKEAPNSLLVGCDKHSEPQPCFLAGFKVVDFLVTTQSGHIGRSDSLSTLIPERNHEHTDYKNGKQ
jgi:hypothetical protein